jgi:hypothetical protein
MGPILLILHEFLISFFYMLEKYVRIEWSMIFMVLARFFFRSFCRAATTASAEVGTMCGSVLFVSSLVFTSSSHQHDVEMT